MTTWRIFKLSPYTLPLLVAATACGCSAASNESTPPAQTTVAKDVIDLGATRLEALIVCYKVIILTQQRYSGSGVQHDGIAGALAVPKRSIEDRLIGDLTEGRQKARVASQVEERLQSLIESKPYTVDELLLNTAQKCSDLEQRNGWAELPK
jgi:hypothetical protein